MNREDIIRMAKKAWLTDIGAECLRDGAEVYIDIESLKSFAELVAEHECEACAEICDRFQARDVGMQPAECAGAIRARGFATLRVNT